MEQHDKLGITTKHHPTPSRAKLLLAAATCLVRDQPRSLFGGLGPKCATPTACRDGLFGPYVSDYLQILPGCCEIEAILIVPPTVQLSQQRERLDASSLVSQQRKGGRDLDFNVSQRTEGFRNADLTPSPDTVVAETPELAEKLISPKYRPTGFYSSRYKATGAGKQLVTRLLSEWEGPRACWQTWTAWQTAG